MKTRRTTDNVGISKGFTPQRNTNFKSDVSSLIRCEVIGEGITKPTFIFFREDLLEEKMIKYAAKGQRLFAPGIPRLDNETFQQLRAEGKQEEVSDPTPEISLALKPKLPSNNFGRPTRPVVEVQTGQRFPTATIAAEKLHLTKASVVRGLKTGKLIKSQFIFKYA